MTPRTPNSQEERGLEFERQRIFVVLHEDYVYLVPFVEDEQAVFSKTIIPSRKAADRRLNIRISSKDLEAIQRRALAEGLPYQTLIASLLHKYAAGRLIEA